MDIYLRIGEKEKCFSQKIIWPEEVLNTLPAKLDFYRGVDGTRINKKDVILASTFPLDYNFNNESVNYVCGMSVPPIMIKRIAEKIYQNWFKGN